MPRVLRAVNSWRKSHALSCGGPRRSRRPRQSLVPAATAGYRKPAARARSEVRFGCGADLLHVRASWQNGINHLHCIPHLFPHVIRRKPMVRKGEAQSPRSNTGEGHTGASS
jgi:hypothetical protein